MEKATSPKAKDSWKTYGPIPIALGDPCKVETYPESDTQGSPLPHHDFEATGPDVVRRRCHPLDVTGGTN